MSMTYAFMCACARACGAAVCCCGVVWSVDGPCVWHVCLHVCMHVCMYVCMHVCMCLCMCVYACVSSACVSACVHVCVCVCVCVCMHVSASLSLSLSLPVCVCVSVCRQPEEARGPVVARNLSRGLYSNEHYLLSIDSHSR